MGSYEYEVLADSPTFVLPMDEASGNLADLVDGKTATAFGSPTYGATGPVTGHTAIDFPASTAVYFTVADDADLDLGADGFSIELWYARDVDTAYYETLISKESPAYAVGLDDTDRMCLFKRGTGTIAAGPPAVAANGAWHHYVWTRAVGASVAGDTKLYVDGTLQTLQVETYASALGDNTTALYIGKENNDAPASGKIAYVALYKSVLSQARISAHYDNRATVVPETNAPAGHASGRVP